MYFAMGSSCSCILSELVFGLLKAKSIMFFVFLFELAKNLISLNILELLEVTKTDIGIIIYQNWFVNNQLLPTSPLTCISDIALIFNRLQKRERFSTWFFLCLLPYDIRQGEPNLMISFIWSCCLPCGLISI